MLIEVELCEICRSSGMNAIVLREMGGERRQFPIYIGQFEAEALEIALHRRELPRPFTHDLILNVIHEMGGILKRVVIDKLEDNTFFSKLHIEIPGRPGIQVDSRPSDAIVLATKTAVSIHVDESVLLECHAEPAGESDEETPDDTE